MWNKREHILTYFSPNIPTNKACIKSIHIKNIFHNICWFLSYYIVNLIINYWNLENNKEQFKTQ